MIKMISSPPPVIANLHSSPVKAVPDSFTAAADCIATLIAAHRKYHADLLAEIQPELEQMQQLQTKLEQRLIQIAAFGLVSRGKSAVLNAIYGETVFPTGALNGVTQWPRSIRWAWPNSDQPTLQIELTDTPGLDEIAGAERGQMAQAVARNADLILMITAGPLSSIEINALSEFALLQTPLLLVLNKQDLYPDLQPEQLHQQFQDPRLAARLTPAQMVKTAASPAPIQVRVEWPDGRSHYAWESAPSQLEELKHRLEQFLQTEASLVATTHALLAAQFLDQAINQRIYLQRQPQANRQIVQYGLAKLMFIAGLASGSLWEWGLCLSPLMDLLLIRALQKCYGFPFNRWVATRLARSLLVSSGGLLLSYLVVVGASWLGGFESGIPPFIQAILPTCWAGYGSYRLAQATQTLLRQGVDWQAQSPRISLQILWQQLQPGMLLYPLLPQLQAKLEATPVLHD
jgi:GTPase SAR1 family protein